MEPSDRYKFSSEFSEKNHEIRLRGSVALQSGNYVEAKEIFEENYRVLLAVQEELERPFHKGDALFNLGLAFFFLKDYENAIKNFLLAYVEDALSSKEDYEDNADRAPAAQMLRDVYIFDLRVLREIKNRVKKIKLENGLDKALKPEEILQSAAIVLEVDLNHLIPLAQRLPEIGKSVLGFPQPRELRVFIGTNYDVNIGVIPLVKDGIDRKNSDEKRNYVGVAVLDLSVPPDAIHDVSLALLHTCSYVIIDVSHPGGQFVEIERIRDYGIRPDHVLLLRQSAKDPEHPPHVSGMISTLGYKIEYYYDPREIIAITKNFLP